MAKDPDSLPRILGVLQLVREETKHAAHIRIGSLEKKTWIRIMYRI